MTRPDDPDRDMGNDLDYLIGLAEEARNNEEFESDYERALWAVSQWCQELNVRPDLSDYTTGLTVPPGEQRGEHPRFPGEYDYQGQAEGQEAEV